MAKQSKNLNVVVTLQKEARGELDEVVQKLEKAGLRVTSSMKMLGMVTGAVTSAKRAALSKIAGVKDVSEQGVVSVPPGETPG